MKCSFEPVRLARKHWYLAVLAVHHVLREVVASRLHLVAVARRFVPASPAASTGAATHSTSCKFDVLQALVPKLSIHITWTKFRHTKDDCSDQTNASPMVTFWNCGGICGMNIPTGTGRFMLAAYALSAPMKPSWSCRTKLSGLNRGPKTNVR